MPFDGNEVAFESDTEITQILARARELIKKGWCKGAAAQTASRTTVPIHDPQARRFCVLGALHRVGFESDRLGHPVFDDDSKAGKRAVDLVCERIGGTRDRSGIGDWNDLSTTRKSHVLALFDTLIAERQGRK